jgi:mono/diheme cytochrome c family protein
MISRQSIVLAAAAITFGGALAVSSASAQTGADADGVFTSNSQFGEQTGEALYKNVCAGCHMPAGEGAVGAGFYPALASNPKLVARGYPVYVVMKGLNGMPPIGEMMTDEQVAAVVNYVRTHFGNSYADTVQASDVAGLR